MRAFRSLDSTIFDLLICVARVRDFLTGKLSPGYFPSSGSKLIFRIEPKIWRTGRLCQQ